jgi:sugar-specific transcriptional regulator TrmB
MDDAILKLKDLFCDLLPSFGVNHAKVYSALMFGEVKTASHLAKETGIAPTKVYLALRDLTEYKLINCTSTHPINYYVKNPGKIISKLVERKINFLNKKPEEFKKILNNQNGDEGKEYLIRFNGIQTKLIDNKNKTIIKDAQEIKFIRKKLEKIESKFEQPKPWSIYR